MYIVKIIFCHLAIIRLPRMFSQETGRKEQALLQQSIKEADLQVKAALNKFRFTKLAVHWLKKNIIGSENPRLHGKGLTENRSGHRRYRVGDYRLICDIDDDRIVILALSVGHRRSVYDNWFSSRIINDTLTAQKRRRNQMSAALFYESCPMKSIFLLFRANSCSPLWSLLSFCLVLASNSSNSLSV